MKRTKLGPAAQSYCGSVYAFFELQIISDLKELLFIKD